MTARKGVLVATWWIGWICRTRAGLAPHLLFFAVSLAPSPLQSTVVLPHSAHTQFPYIRKTTLKFTWISIFHYVVQSRVSVCSCKQFWGAWNVVLFSGIKCRFVNPLFFMAITSPKGWQKTKLGKSKRSQNSPVIKLGIRHQTKIYYRDQRSHHRWN